MNPMFISFTEAKLLDYRDYIDAFLIAHKVK